MDRIVKRHKQIVNIGDTDENADWIKTPENRESERRIHEKLAKEHGEEDSNPEGSA